MSSNSEAEDEDGRTKSASSSEDEHDVEQKSAKRLLIEGLYEKHNPSKIVELASLLEKYGEDRLLSMMKKKYMRADPNARVKEIDAEIAEATKEIQALVAEGGTKGGGFHLVTQARTRMEGLEAEKRDLVYQMSNCGSQADAKANVDPRINTMDATQFAKMISAAEEDTAEQINDVERGCAEEMLELNEDIADAKRRLSEYVSQHGAKDMEATLPITDEIKKLEEAKQQLQRTTNKRVSKLKGDLARKRQENLAVMQVASGGGGGGAAGGTASRRASISNALSGMANALSGKPETDKALHALQGDASAVPSVRRRFSVSRTKDDEVRRHTCGKPTDRWKCEHF